MSKTNIEIVRIKDRDYIVWEGRYYYCMHAKKLNRPSPFHSGTRGGIGIDELVNVHTNARLIQHPNYSEVKDFFEKEYGRSLQDEVNEYIKSESRQETPRDDLIAMIRSAEITYNDYTFTDKGVAVRTQPREGTLTIQFIVEPST